MRWLWLVVVLVLSSSSVFAQGDNLADAKRLFRAGARAYDAGQFAAAAKAFEQAYELSPRAPLRFSAAQALKRQYTIDRDPVLLSKAKTYFEAYIDEVKKGQRVKDAVEALGEIELLLASIKSEPEPAEGEGEGEGEVVLPPPVPAAPATGTLQVDSDVPGATAFISGRAGAVTDLPQPIELPVGTYEVTIRAKGYEDYRRTVRVTPDRLALAYPTLRAKPAKLEVTADDGADVLVDGRPAGRSPLSLELPAGQHQVIIGQTGHDVFLQNVTLERGDAQSVEADLGMTTQRIISWVVLGGAGVTLTAAVVLAISSASQQRDARVIRDLTEGDNARALTVAERDRYNDHISARDNLNRFAGGAFALAAAFGAGGLMMFFIDDPDLYGAAARADDATEEQDKPVEKKDSIIELDAAVVPMFDSPGGVVFLRGTF